jgi:DNA invertase Pin-like site-specific DNA recombinase
MSIYGYARVSTLDQDFSIQHAELKAAGCDVIRERHGSRRPHRTRGIARVPARR